MVIPASMVAVCVIACLPMTVSASAIPMWEFLTYEEKLGKLFYIFIHLVEEYCKETVIPDCEHVLALYGVSNLVKMESISLDHLDPYQRDARDKIWQTIMNSKFKLPEITFSLEDEDNLSFTVTTEHETKVADEQQNEVITQHSQTNNSPALKKT